MRYNYVSVQSWTVWNISPVEQNLENQIDDNADDTWKPTTYDKRSDAIESIFKYAKNPLKHNDWAKKLGIIYYP